MDIVQVNMFDGKVCAKCHEWTPIDQFDRHPRTRDRRVSSCKQCCKVYRKARSAAAVEKTRAWRIEHKDRFKEYRREYGRRVYKPHPSLRPSEEESRERNQETRKKWETQNKARRQAIRQAYRARRKQAPGTVTTAEWQELCARYGNKCLRCGATGALSMDHVLPLSKGGSHTIGNLQPLCSRCNSSKRARAIDYRP